MPNLETLIAQLKLDEGKVTNAKGRHILYKCPSDRWTLGYGRNVEDRGISEVEAEGFLVRDILEAQQDAAALFVNWLTLDEVRRNVLTNMSYNLGAVGLFKFKKLIAAVGERRYDDAGGEMLNSKWAVQVKDRATRLAQEMLTGKVAG